MDLGGIASIDRVIVYARVPNSGTNFAQRICPYYIMGSNRPFSGVAGPGRSVCVGVAACECVCGCVRARLCVTGCLRVCLRLCGMRGWRGVVFLSASLGGMHVIVV